MIAAIYASRKVQEALAELKKEGIDAGKKALIHRLTPTAQQKAAKEAIRLFAEKWNEELEDKCEFSSAIEGYQDLFKKLIDVCAVDIADSMDPEIRDVDLRRIQTTWAELKLDDLPESFDWSSVASAYAKAIRIYIKRDAELRPEFDTALRERTAEAAERAATATERLAGPDPGFDLEGYRKFLIEKKCNALQLAVMHSSTYEFDRKLTLWSIFVPQTARESAPILEIPPEVLRKMHKEGHLTRPEEQE